MNSKERDRAWYLRANHIRGRELTLRRVVRRLFHLQEDEVIKKLVQHLRKKTAKGFSIEAIIFDRAKWDEMFGEQIGAQIAATVEEMGQVYAGEDFNLHHPSVQSAVQEYTNQMVPEINKTTRRKLAESLNEGMAQGESIRDLVKRVQEIYKDAGGRRAITIARTIAFGSSNLGLLHGMNQGGWQRKMWLTSRDERVRPSHRIDGQIKPVNKPFVLADGREMMYPHDINERCTMIATNEPENT